MSVAHLSAFIEGAMCDRDGRVDGSVAVDRKRSFAHVVIALSAIFLASSSTTTALSSSSSSSSSPLSTRRDDNDDDDDDDNVMISSPSPSTAAQLPSVSASSSSSEPSTTRTAVSVKRVCCEVDVNSTFSNLRSNRNSCHPTSKSR